MSEAGTLLLAIDTSSDTAGLALSEAGHLLGCVGWRTRQNHSRQLLPALEWLLERLERRREHLGAVAVCIGPGSYAGLRVGLSTAKTLAFALGVPLAAVGRLDADAWPVASLREGRVFAVHAAGRAELAWACFRGGKDGLKTLEPPRLGRVEELLSLLTPADAVVAEPASGLLSSETAAATGARFLAASPLRVEAVALLGSERLRRGEKEDPDSLVPLYLRAPAIGPQPPR